MDDRQQLFLTENTSKLLVKFSIPAIVSMLVNAIYNLVDTIFVANGAGTAEYNGVIIAIPVVTIISAFGIGVSQGAASMISIALGRDNVEEVDDIIGNLYLLIVIASLIFFITGLFFAEPIVYLFGGRGESLAPGVSYARIMMIGSLFMITSSSMCMILRAVGEFKIVMAVVIIGVVVNTILDPILIYDWGFGLGATGAALATLFGNFVSFIFVIVYVFRKVPLFRPKLKNMRLKPRISGDIIVIGLPGIIRNVSVSIATIVFNLVLIGYGPTYLSIFGTFSRVSQILIMPSFGIVQGLRPIAGVNYGAKKYARVREISKAGLIIIHVYLFLFATILATIFSKQILSVFVGPQTSEAELFMSEGVRAFRIMLPMLVLSSTVRVQSAVTQSLGEKIRPTIIASLRVVLVIPILLILEYAFDLGITGVWLAYPIADVISTIISGISFASTMKMLRKLEYSDCE